MNPINYIIQQLLDYGFSQSEVIDFLTIVYNCLISNKDIESQLGYNHNDKYIDAFYLVSEEIYEIPTQYWNEWITTVSLLPNSLKSKFLFLGNYSSITGGKLYNTLGIDYLTVSGSVGNETYQCPNTTPYINADIDYIWFNSDTSQRTTSTIELISYDFSSTLIKYNDVTPYSIRIICIVKSGEVLTTSEVNIIHNYFQLSIFWSGVTNFNGHIKGNREASRSVWTSYDPSTIALLNRMTTAGDTISDAQKTNIDTTIKALKTASLFDTRFDALWVPHIAGVNSAKLNWIQNLYNLNPILSPTFTTNIGYNSDGSSSYIDTGYKPLSNGVKFTQDNASFGYKTSGSISGSHMMGASDNYTKNVITGNYGGPVSAINDDLGGGYGQVDAIGYNCLARNSSSAYNQYINSNEYVEIRNSNTLVDHELLLLAAYYPYPSVQFYYPATSVLEFAFLGAFISQMEFMTLQTIINNYIAAL